MADPLLHVPFWLAWRAPANACSRRDRAHTIGRPPLALPTSVRAIATLALPIVHLRRDIKDEAGHSVPHAEKAPAVWQARKSDNCHFTKRAL